MFKKMTLVLLALVVLTFASSARANFTGCRIHNFIGTFVRVQPNVDLFGDGTAIHTWIYQLQLHIDGTVTQFISATPEFMINAGTSSEYKGSWLCRSDGKLVVSMLEGGYNPVRSAQNPNAVVPDIQLASYVRATYLFSVDNDNTLTRIQVRTRTYGPNEDPTNPTGGSLGSLVTTPFTYTRFNASDADLLLP
jgi:hypothetical protein